MANDLNKITNLNSFSIGSILNGLWDTTLNTFKATIKNVENSVMNSVIAGQASAQAAANNSSTPTVAVQGGLNTQTMLFLGAGLVSVLLFTRKK